MAINKPIKDTYKGFKTGKLQIIQYKHFHKIDNNITSGWFMK